MSQYPYFTTEELSCHGDNCCNGQASMEPEFMKKMVALRKELGFPFIVTSAYRCPLHNSRVSKTGESGPHTTGRAMDVALSHEQAYQLLELAILSGQFKGFGINQKGGHRFIHLDDIPGVDRLWSY